MAACCIRIPLAPLPPPPLAVAENDESFLRSANTKFGVGLVDGRVGCGGRFNIIQIERPPCGKCTPIAFLFRAQVQVRKETKRRQQENKLGFGFLSALQSLYTISLKLRSPRNLATCSVPMGRSMSLFAVRTAAPLVPSAPRTLAAAESTAPSH